MTIGDCKFIAEYYINIQAFISCVPVFTLFSTNTSNLKLRRVNIMRSPITIEFTLLFVELS